MLRVLKRATLSLLRRAGYDLVRAAQPSAPPPDPPPEPAPEPIAPVAPEPVIPPPTPPPPEPEPLRPAAGLTESIVGTTPPPISPPMIDELVRRYADYKDPRDREIISRALMEHALADDRFFNVMRHAEGPWELHRQLAAAIAFGDDDLQKCEQLFKSLNEDYPNSFNGLCYGRTLIAAGKTNAAIRHFRAALALNPEDHHAGLQLATLLFWTGATNEANQVLAKFVHLLEFEREVVIPRQAELQRAIETKQVHPDASSDDFYTDDYTIKIWWGYFQAFQRSPFREPDAALETKVRSAVSACLKGKAAGASTFIEFGAFCGYTLHKLALEFPSIRFVGIDRPAITRDLSAKFFQAPNLKFSAGSLLDEIDGWNLGDNAVLFHNRTAVFCYPEYMRQLYTKAKAKGVRHIMFQEGDTFSCWYRKFYEYGSYPEIAINSRSKMWMHDFGRLLPETGLKIDSMTHVDPNLLLDEIRGYGARHRLVHAIRH
jgi:tetratricopeptide (TPR) repeat protein